MLYEYRAYTALPGKMGSLTEVMKVAFPIFKRIGMKVLGPWKPIVGDNNNSIVYMLAFEDAADRDKKWEAFQSDPEWKEKRAKVSSEPLTASQFNSFLKPTSYSPAK